MLPLGLSEILGVEVSVRDPEYTPPPPGKVGRPRSAISWDRVALSLFCGSNLKQAAAAQGVTRRTLNRACLRENGYPLAEFLARFDSAGQDALNVAQTLSALGGDPRMLAFLGMNRLGQSRKIDRRNLHAGAVTIYGGSEYGPADVRLPRNGKEAAALPAPADTDAEYLAQLEAETDGQAIELEAET